MKPTTVKIGYKDFTIRMASNLPDCVGDCTFPASDHLKGKIRIQRGMAGVEKANTVLHEILHAICYTQGLQLSEKTEERVVFAMTNGLIQFIRDNPRFALRLIDLAVK